MRVGMTGLVLHWPARTTKQSQKHFSFFLNSSAAFKELTMVAGWPKAYTIKLFRHYDSLIKTLIIMTLLTTFVNATLHMCFLFIVISKVIYK